MPDHEIALALLEPGRADGRDQRQPHRSAPGQTAAEAQEQLGDSVAVYLDGGPASGGPASTILDCTGGSPLTLREGALTRAEIDVALADAQQREAAEAARRAAVAAAAAEPPARGRSGPRIAGSRRRGSSPNR